MKRIVALFVVTMMMMAVGLCARAQEPATKLSTQARSTLERAAEAARALRQLDATDVADDIPEVLHPLQAEFKHAVRDFLLQLLNDAPRADVQAIEAAAISAFRETDIYSLTDGNSASGRTRFLPYGELRRIKIAQPEGHPDLLAVVTAVALPCDSDASFYVFQRADGGWRLHLEHEQNGYRVISDALGAIDYAISPPDASGRWYAVVSGVSAACSSAWQSIHYTVLRPAEGSTVGRTLLSRFDTLYLGGDEVQKLTVERDWFRLSWVGGSIDTDISARVHVVQYAVGPYSVSRVPPFAIRAQDFVEEWMELAWEQALSWTQEKNAASVQPWHKKLHRWHPSSEELRIQQFMHAATVADASASYLKGAPDESFEFVQPCPQPDTWLIGLKIKGDGFPPKLFFKITRSREAFFLESVSDMRIPGCPGKAPPCGMEDTLPDLP